MGIDDRCVIPGTLQVLKNRLPLALRLTFGNVSDAKAAPALLERAGPSRHLLGGKGYDTDPCRRSRRDAGAIPIAPIRRNRNRTLRYDKLAATSSQAWHWQQPSPSGLERNPTLTIGGRGPATTDIDANTLGKRRLGD